jgi:hypothetical protein
MYIKYIVEHMDRLFSFYSFHRAKTNFRNYQGRQRAREEMLSIFLDGGKKYNAKKRKYTRKNRRRRKKRSQTWHHQKLSMGHFVDYW